MPSRTQITDVNPFMVELLGYARDEFLGKELWEIGVLTDAAASQDAFRVLQATGYIRYEDLPLQTKAGARRDVEFVSNVYLENGHQVIQCNIRDITARLQAEAEIHRLNADLEQRVRDRTVQLDALNHDLEMFNASVSHDLHTPLRQIDSFVEALRDDYAELLDADGLQLIRHIGGSTQRMHTLIDALLALSHVSRHALEWQPVDLSALAHEIAIELHHRQPTRQVDWVIADGLSTHGDPRLLRIVLDNLLSNAWKFTSTTAQARIEFGEQTAPDGTSVWFVRDNGAGFDMAYGGQVVWGVPAPAPRHGISRHRHRPRDRATHHSPSRRPGLGGGRGGSGGHVVFHTPSGRAHLAQPTSIVLLSGHEDLEACTSEKALENSGFSPHSFHRVAQLTTQMWDVKTAHIAQLDPFELLPEALVRIQLRGIGRQALQVEAWRRAISQELLDGMAAVDGRSIPDNHHPARDLAQQVLQEGDHIPRIDGAVLAVEVQLALWRDRTDGREMISGSTIPAGWASGPRGIGAHDTGQGIKARLVYEEDAFVAGPAPLFDGGPGVVAPPGNRRLVALAGAPGGLLRTPADRLAQAADMAWDGRRHQIRGESPQQCVRGSRARRESHRLRGLAATGSGRWASCSAVNRRRGTGRMADVAVPPTPPSRARAHPLTDGPFADAKRLGDLALGPALLREVPGLHPSGFFPIVR